MEVLRVRRIRGGNGFPWGVWLIGKAEIVEHIRSVIAAVLSVRGPAVIESPVGVAIPGIRCSENRQFKVFRFYGNSAAEREIDSGSALPFEGWIPSRDIAPV